MRMKSALWPIGIVLIGMSTGFSVGILIGGNQICKYFIPPFLIIGVIFMIMGHYSVITAINKGGK